MSGIWYSMDQREFYVILAALGVRRWYGFGIEDAEMPETCEDVNRLIADLYQNEVISFDKAELTLSGGYSEAFDVLKSAEKCICAVSGREHGSTVLSYGKGDTVVVTERDRANRDLIRFSMIRSSAWPGMILRETVEVDRIASGKAMVSDDEVRTLADRKMTAGEAASFPDVLGVYDIMDIRNGRTDERLTIREKGILQYMVLERACSDDIMIMEGGLSEAVRFLGRWKEVLM